MNVYRVLIVDDNAVFAQQVQQMLEEGIGIGKFKCDIAVTITQAVSMLVSAKPPYDVCLLDLNLNGKGPPTLRHMKNANVDVPFIIITADKDSDIEDECFKLGAEDFIRKEDVRPSLMDKLEERIEYAIKRHGARLTAKSEFAPVKALVTAMIEKPLHQRESDKAEDTQLEPKR